MRNYTKTMLTAIFILMALSLCSTGCITLGRPFPVGAVYQIKIDKTTRAEISRNFGMPWRRGIDSGYKTWTYAHYRYNLFGSQMTRDLIVRFDKDGVVKSYTFNSSYPQDEQ